MLLGSSSLVSLWPDRILGIERDLGLSTMPDVLPGVLLVRIGVEGDRLERLAIAELVGKGLELSVVGLLSRLAQFYEGEDCGVGGHDARVGESAIRRGAEGEVGEHDGHGQGDDGPCEDAAGDEVLVEGAHGCRCHLGEVDDDAPEADFEGVEDEAGLAAAEALELAVVLGQELVADDEEGLAALEECQ